MCDSQRPSGGPFLPVTCAQNKSHNRLYPAIAPACKSDSKLPGSKYAMDISSPGEPSEINYKPLSNHYDRLKCNLPGPAYVHSFLNENHCSDTSPVSISAFKSVSLSNRLPDADASGVASIMSLLLKEDFELDSEECIKDVLLLLLKASMCGGVIEAIKIQSLSSV